MCKKSHRYPHSDADMFGPTPKSIIPLPICLSSVLRISKRCHISVQKTKVDDHFKKAIFDPGGLYYKTFCRCNQFCNGKAGVLKPIKISDYYKDSSLVHYRFIKTIKKIYDTDPLDYTL
jgi:hypothetical protein